MGKDKVMHPTNISKVAKTDGDESASFIEGPKRGSQFNAYNLNGKKKSKD